MCTKMFSKKKNSQNQNYFLRVWKKIFYFPSAKPHDENTEDILNILWSIKNRKKLL